MKPNKTRDKISIRLAVCHLTPGPNDKTGPLLAPDSELTSTVLVAKIREPPHVPEADDLSCHGQQELYFTGPLASAGDAGYRVTFRHLQLERGLGNKMGIHWSATTTSKDIEEDNIYRAVRHNEHRLMFSAR